MMGKLGKAVKKKVEKIIVIPEANFEAEDMVTVEDLKP